jgi:hypothetical protein
MWLLTPARLVFLDDEGASVPALAWQTPVLLGGPVFGFRGARLEPRIAKRAGAPAKPLVEIAFVCRHRCFTSLALDRRHRDATVKERTAAKKLPRPDSLQPRV